MRLVKHLLEGKGGAVHWIGPEQPVLDAIRMMADKYVGALLVMEGGQMLGIVSERDIVRQLARQGQALLETAVADLMTTSVITAGPHETEPSNSGT